MALPTTAAEAIARIIEAEIEHDIKDNIAWANGKRAANAILSYLASRREAQEAVAGELLPCPFCGGAAEIERYGTPSVSTVYRCTECACRLETGEEWNHGADWNRRTAPPSPVPAPAGEKSHVMCIGPETIARLRAGESVWFDDVGAGAVAADDLLSPPAGEVERPTPNERFSPRMLLLDDLHAVCVGGRWDGWKFWKHPDGQWVSLEKLAEEPRAALNGGCHD